MNRAEQAEKTTKALYGGASALGVTDPEFAAIKERLIYGEVYAEEKLSARLRELVILVVATTNQTMNEVKRHTAAALACGVKPEEIKEAVYHCAPYIGLGKAENAVNAVNAVFAEKGIVLPLASGQTVTEESRLLDGIAAQKSIFGDQIDAMRGALRFRSKASRRLRPKPASKRDWRCRRLFSGSGSTRCAPPRRRTRRTFRTISPPTASAIFIRESFCPSTSASC